MSANIDVTILAVFENKDLFFQLIDKADEALGGEDGLEISAYNKALNNLSGALDKQTDKVALFNKISLANLERHELIDKSGSSGKFYLDQHLMGLLRKVDRKRIKYLSSAELEGLRRDLIGLYERAVETKFEWVAGDEDYDEFRDYVYSTIRRVYMTIKANINSLRGRADFLSNALKNQDSNEMEHYAQQDKTLQMVSKIYVRNVLPTLEFLNERHAVRSRSSNNKEMTAIVAIQAVIDIFSGNNLVDEASRLQTLKAKLLAGAAVVSDVRLGLEKYTLLEREMRQFCDKVEARKILLLEAIEEKNNGRKKGSLIASRPDLFTASSCLSGLKRRNAQNNPIDIAINNGRVYLAEHIRVSTSNSAAAGEMEYLPIKEINRASREHHIAMMQLKACIAKMGRINPNVDIIQFLHEYLLENWSSYKLEYVWEAIPLIKDANRDKIVGDANLKVITFERYKLTYYPRYIKYGAAL
jgi:hypothetical protein